MVDDPCSPCAHYERGESCIGSCPPGNYNGLVTEGESFCCLSPSGGLNKRALRTDTWRHINIALSCHAAVHLEAVMSVPGAVFRSYCRPCSALTGHGVSRSKPQGVSGEGKS